MPLAIFSLEQDNQEEEGWYLEHLPAAAIFGGHSPRKRPAGQGGLDVVAGRYGDRGGVPWKCLLAA